MIQCMCIVQQGQKPNQQRDELSQLLNSFAEDSFGAKAEIDWIVVSAGNGFTAAKPSTSSIVAFTAPDPVEQGQRVALLTQLCDRWMTATGCSLNEIVAAINDPPPA